ncbi:MAG: hypothetical protein MAG453_00992 [Calditrichaeota bacterium]|nr:hypothetical protein [Calditrichota bacterium]
MGKVLSALVCVAALLAVQSPHAALLRQGNTVVIAQSDTLAENLVITGESINLYGTVLADVLAAARNYSQHGDVADNLFLACQNADINGRVGGDILAFAQTVNVKSDTTGDVRAAGQTVNVYGFVDGDLFTGAQTVWVGPDAEIAGDLYVGAADVTVFGNVRGDLKGGMESLTIGGAVDGNVEAWCDRLMFTGDGVVRGDLDYHAEEPSGEDYAQRVSGAISFHEIVEDGDEDGDGLGVFIGFLLLVTALITTLLLVLLWRSGVTGAVTALDRNTGASIVGGLLGFAAIPVLAVLAFLLVITFPVGGILLLLYPVLLYLGWIVFGVWLGRTLLNALLRREVSLLVAGLVGVLLLGILAYVPWVGWIIALVAIVIGLGMMLVQLHSMRLARVE